jgi:FlaA1/EpsC-like NDP-sugar epimerase
MLSLAFCVFMLTQLTSALQGASLETTSNSPSQHRFKDQVVIVTGASKGIGREIATLFAQEGAKFVLVARDEAALKTLQETLSNSGGGAFYLIADVNSEQNIRKRIFGS